MTIAVVTYNTDIGRVANVKLYPDDDAAEKAVGQEWLNQTLADPPLTWVYCRQADATPAPDAPLEPYRQRSSRVGLMPAAEEWAQSAIE